MSRERVDPPDPGRNPTPPKAASRGSSTPGLRGRFKRRFSRVVRGIAAISWRIASPMTVGVRILLIRDESVLLVRHVYQDCWYLPGGGVKKHETLAEAIRREVAEEVGVTLGEIELLNVYTSFAEARRQP